jgi:hypothetical protein
MQHLVVPDTQICPGLTKAHLKHLDALSVYVNEMEPEKIMILGDWWDMPSLCSYDIVGSPKTEGRRIKKDIDAGNKAMDKFLDNLSYSPEIHFFMGNHEERLLRLSSEDARFEGMFDDAFSLSGANVYDFLDPVNIDGVYYSHYFVNQYTGRPLGGTALTQLKTLGFSFTAGHKQILDTARMDRNNGETVQGLVAGAFYSHDEEYKGPQGNNHWRGIIHKHDVENGMYDFDVIGLNNLVKGYSK